MLSVRDPKQQEAMLRAGHNFVSERLDASSISLTVSCNTQKDRFDALELTLKGGSRELKNVKKLSVIGYRDSDTDMETSIATDINDVTYIYKSCPNLQVEHHC